MVVSDTIVNEFNDKYRAIYTDIWQIHKKYMNVKTSDEWEHLLDEMGQFTDKYKSKFALKLAQTVLTEIEEHNKKGKG